MRLNKIDELRALTLISMILYHICWDLKYIAGFSMDWYAGPIGFVWQQSICITFILISGFCFSMGHKRLKRSLIVFLSGFLITGVTLFVLPENRVVFGVLTFLGTAGLITIPLDNFIKKHKISISGKWVLFGTSFLLFIIFYRVNQQYLNFIFTKVTLPDSLYKGYINTFLGFTDKTFFSTDYFSLFPHYFMYLCGYFLYKIYEAAGSEKIKDYLSTLTVKPLAFIGSHSLIIYLLHQPLAYFAIMLLFL